MATPPQAIDLDLSATSRGFKLAFAEGTTPLVRANLKNDGAAYSATGWTGTLYLQGAWEDAQVVAIPSTAVGATWLDFQLDATDTTLAGLYQANFICTDGTATVEWQRGTVDVRASPGTSGAGVLDLTTPISWSGFTYALTGSAGPYRAGTNVTFSTNADGSANINAASTTVADGDKGDITVSASGATWTIDAGVVTTTKMGGDVTTAGKALLDDANAAAQRTTLGLAAVASSGSAADLSAGTLPDARFPATLPAASGANLTALNASNVSSGFLPTANLSPSDGGATVATMANGTILASDGTLYKRLGNSGTAAVLGGGSGGLEFYSILPAVSGVNLTNLNASNLASGTVGTARLGTGTADNTTYLRGDSTWASISAGIGGTLGAVDNAATRADGTGAATAQGSDLIVNDVATATQNNLTISNGHAGQTNSSFGIIPKGTGAFFLGPAPDGTITGGNARGTNAVDLQWGTRGAATQVASGATSIIVGGERNTASAQYSLAGGYGSSATQTLAFAWGDSATAGFARSVMFALDSSSGGSTDRLEQFKIKGDGGFTLLTAGGTCTNWGKLSTAPVTGINAGDIFYNTTTNKHQGYNGATWNDFF